MKVWGETKPMECVKGSLSGSLKRFVLAWKLNTLASSFSQNWGKEVLCQRAASLSFGCKQVVWLCWQTTVQVSRGEGLRACTVFSKLPASLQVKELCKPRIRAGNFSDQSFPHYTVNDLPMDLNGKGPFKITEPPVILITASQTRFSLSEIQYRSTFAPGSY